ncbi:melanocortin receptor 5-like [Montipora capricornis]|uniref:melanocortin receptor 5-like n=1 Tax=Montipora capricornis TaxID=246305 RepID=UPI0035F13B3B
MAESSHTPLICIVVINMLLAVTALVGNLLILVAVGKDSSLHPPSKLLLRNLAASDLFVGILAEPTFLAHWLSVVKEEMKFCLFVHRIIYVNGNMLCVVSILTMTAIAVERLLALTLRLRYRQVVTLKRTFVLLIVFWFLSIAGSTLHLVDYLLSLWYGYIAGSVCLAISLLSYGKIFFTLRRYSQNQMRDHVQPSEACPLNVARYRKAVNCALLLQLSMPSAVLKWTYIIFPDADYESCFCYGPWDLVPMGQRTDSSLNKPNTALFPDIVLLLPTPPTSVKLSAQSSRPQEVTNLPPMAKLASPTTA